jgi:hypothetical protein
MKPTKAQRDLLRKLAEPGAVAVYQHGWRHMRCCYRMPDGRTMNSLVTRRWVRGKHLSYKSIYTITPAGRAVLEASK